MVTDITSLEKHMERCTSNTLSFCLNLLKYRFNNMFLKEYISPGFLQWSFFKLRRVKPKAHLVGLEVSETPSTSSVWLSDHWEDYRSCARPFNNLLQICPLLKHHTLTNKAVWTLRRVFSIPPQRRQGLDPRPIWLLVETTSALWPEIEYRLRKAHHTLMDVTRYFWYSIYISIYVSVLHFYDLSALVCCWYLVSIWRIIYIFFKCAFFWLYSFCG